MGGLPDRGNSTASFVHVTVVYAILQELGVPFWVPMLRVPGYFLETTRYTRIL